MSGPVQFSFAGSEGALPPGAVKAGFVEAEPQPDEAKRVKGTTFVVDVKLGSKFNPKNILALAKKRLREVKSELKKLKALEKEKGELERLIAAAESKPSNLRAIKQTG